MTGVAKTALADADKTAIATALAGKPDIVVITGHNLDVEPAIVEIGKGAYSLEKSSQKNYDWQFKFKHRTVAWRNEARYAQLGGAQP